MAEKRQRYDAEFREGAVRIVIETGKSVAEVAAGLGVKESTLVPWSPGPLVPWPPAPGTRGQADTGR